MPLTRTMTGPNWLLRTSLTPPCGSAKTALASSLSVMDEGVEARPAFKLGRGRAGVGIIGKQDLLQIALLGRAELRILSCNLLIGGLGVGVGHVGCVGDRVRLKRQNGHFPVFGRAIAGLAIVVEGFERIFRRRGNLARRRSRQEESLRRPGLALIVGFRRDLRLRRG